MTGWPLGKHQVPFKLKKAGVTLSFTREGEALVYRRVQGETTVERLLVSEEDTCLKLLPVEPVTIPKELSPYLLIELAKPVVVAPRSKISLYLCFPLELGVFFSSDKELKILDRFTLARQKYTHYGELPRGVICRYWKSDVHVAPFKPDPLREGELELTVNNPTPHFMELGRVVLNVHHMKLFHCPGVVRTQANLRVIKEGMAETECYESLLAEGMCRSAKLFSDGMVTLIPRKFLMEEGL